MAGAGVSLYDVIRRFSLRDAAHVQYCKIVVANRMKTDTLLLLCKPPTCLKMDALHILLRMNGVPTLLTYQWHNTPIQVIFTATAEFNSAHVDLYIYLPLELRLACAERLPRLEKYVIYYFSLVQQCHPSTMVPPIPAVRRNWY